LKLPPYANQAASEFLGFLGTAIRASASRRGALCTASAILGFLGVANDASASRRDQEIDHVGRIQRLATTQLVDPS
jgi:hypothetical protein